MCLWAQLMQDSVVDLDAEEEDGDEEDEEDDESEYDAFDPY